MTMVKKGKGYLGVTVLTVSVMSILFGWAAFVAAGAPPPDSPAVDKNMGAVAQQVLSGSPLTQPPSGSPTGSQAPLPPGILETATQFMEQLSEGVLSMMNNSTNTALYGTGIEASKAMITRHFNGYCAGVETGNCPSDPLLQYGDVKISSVLAGTAYDDDVRTQAAQDYLTNLFVPPSAPLVANLSADLKNGKLDVATVVNDPKLLKKYTQALSDETVLSAARQSFSEMMARRTVSSANAGNVSEMQIIEAEAIKRFMSTAWIQMIKNPSTTQIQLQQEMTAMQAYQNWMAYQHFRQLERIEALLATLIVQNARNSQMIAANIPTGVSASDLSKVSGNTSSTNSDTQGNTDYSLPSLPAQ